MSHSPSRSSSQTPLADLVPTGLPVQLTAPEYAVAPAPVLAEVLAPVGAVVSASASAVAWIDGDPRVRT